MVKKKFFVLIFLLFPNFAFAAKVSDIIDIVKSLIDLLVPVAITFALLFFIWGFAIFISKSGSDDGRAEGRKKMLWGVIAIFVIVSVWGLVWVVARTLGITPGGNRAPVPCLPGGNCVSGTGGGGTSGVDGVGGNSSNGAGGTGGDGPYGPYFFRRVK